MNNYKDLIIKNNLIVNKITYKGKSIIINTDKGKYVIKDNANINIYDYLLSRGFDYFPKIIDYNDKYILFEYIDEIKYDINEKAKDFIRLLSLLHTKTSYYIEISENDIKKIYEDISNKINNNQMFYENLIDIIDTREFMSPLEYYISKNIGIILSAFNNWYEKNKNNYKKRVCTLYNNIDIDNFIKSKDKSYFISLSNTVINNPIYDLISFYNNYSLSFDFYSLLNYYEKIFPLLDNEKELFNIIISIPDIIPINYYSNDFSEVNKVIDKVYNTLNFLTSKEEKDGKTHE